MIAKGKSVKHGFNAINYAVKKPGAEMLRLNKIDTSGIAIMGNPEAGFLWEIFKMSYLKLDRNKPGRKLENNLLRFEISPSDEEAAQLKTREDWQRLLDDFIDEIEKDFDPRSAAAKKRGGKKPGSHLNIRGSKYVAVIHHDSGHTHIHLLVNRVDEDGKTNNDHQIGRRAVEAADRVNRKRGWKDPLTQGKKTPKVEVEEAMTEALKAMPRFNWRLFSSELAKRGFQMVNVKTTDKKMPNGKIQKVVASYGVQGGGKYWKASSIGSRQFTASRCYKTWWSLHPELHKVDGRKLPAVLSETADGLVRDWYNRFNSDNTSEKAPTPQIWFEYVRSTGVPDQFEEVKVKYGNGHLNVPVDKKSYDSMMEGAKSSHEVHGMSDKEITDVVMPMAVTLFSISTVPAELANLMVGLMEEQAPEVGQGGGGVHGELSSWGANDDENARRAGRFAAGVKCGGSRSCSRGRGRR